MTILALFQRRVYTVIVLAILTICLTKKLKNSATGDHPSLSFPIRPGTVPSPSRLFNVVTPFREQTKKHFQAMLNIQGKIYSIHALEQHFFNALFFQAI